MITVLPERAEHAAAVDALLDLSFGPGRYAKTAYRLRDGVDPIDTLSFVALEDGVFRASIRYWPVRIAGCWDALLLGPLAVEPSVRGRGIGIEIMRVSLDKARGLGWSRVILVGNESYYARVGFSRSAASGLSLPGPCDPARVLARALVDGAFDGVAGVVDRINTRQTPTTGTRRGEV